MIDISVKDAIRKAKAEFSDLTDDQMKRGVSRAINHTLGVSKTDARREIQGVYKIRARDVAKAMLLRKAAIRQVVQTGMLITKGTSLPLIGFGARQTKRGVSVNVMGVRKLVRSAFIATMPSGGRAVFGRGYYSQGEFKFRHKRLRKNGSDLPITEMRSISIPKAVSNNVVLRRLSERITQYFPGRLTHELMRLRGNASEG